MQEVTLSKEEVFKGSTNRYVLGVCATLVSKRLLDRLIQFSQEVEKYHFNFIMER